MSVANCTSEHLVTTVFQVSPKLMRSPRISTLASPDLSCKSGAITPSSVVSFNMKNLYMLEKKPSMLTATIVNKAFERNKKKH